MASTTTTSTTKEVASFPFPGETKDGLKLGLSPWQEITLAQVVLPVLGAIFIVIVVIVIACCLIKKKAKPLRPWKEKSCHTIETSHDPSECGIYDIIDEIRASGRAFEIKKSRRPDRMSSNCLLTSQNQPRLQTCSAFTTASSRLLNIGATFDDAIPPRVPLPRTHQSQGLFVQSGSHDSNLTVPRDFRLSVGASENEEEGIYETLDRYWKPSEIRCAYTADNSLTVHKATGGGNIPIRKAPFSSSNSTLGSVVRNSKYEEHSDDPAQASPGPMPNALTLPKKQNLSSNKCTSEDKILCQLTMFQISNADQVPTQTETAFYYVNIQDLLKSSEKQDGLPSVLQHSRLQVLTTDASSSNTQKRNAPNIVLEPVKDSEIPTQQLNAHYNEHQTGAIKKKFNRGSEKTYEKLRRANSTRCPKLVAKKSDSFRGANSELNAVKESYRFRRQSGSFSGTRPSDLTASVKQDYTGSLETARIISKLGPLPPLPVSPHQPDEALRKTGLQQYSGAHFKNDETEGMYPDRVLQCSGLTNSNIPGNCPVSTNIASSNYSCNSEATSVIPSISTMPCFSDERQNYTKNENHSRCLSSRDLSQHQDCRMGPSVNFHLGNHRSRATVQDDSSEDESSTEKSDHDGQRTEHYFVLEPRYPYRDTNDSSDLETDSDEEIH